jgi:hypothetical protein
METDDRKQVQKTSENERNVSIRISTVDREKAIMRLQNAFVEGRLDDAELDERVLKALSSKTAADLAPIISDLPDEVFPQAVGAPDLRSKKLIIGYGSQIERKGRWHVPRKVRPVIFKGHMILDLRTAELSGPETVFNVLAYKGTIEVIVLPGVSVEAHGFAYKGEWINELAGEREAPGAPVIRIHGIAYKSKVIVRHAVKTSLPPVS